MLLSRCTWYFRGSVSFNRLSAVVELANRLNIVAPMFWGTIADKVGRRPIFIACLLTLCLSCIGLALTPTSAYWLLILLRCLQASGSASTVALGIYQSRSSHTEERPPVFTQVRE